MRTALVPTAEWVTIGRKRPCTIDLVSTPLSAAPGGSAPGVGFMAVDTVPNAAVTHTKDGATGTQSGEAPDGRTRVSVGADGTVHAEVSTESTVGDVQMTVDAATDLDPCLDADGRLELSTDVTVRLTVGRSGVSFEMHVDPTGLLDDDANLVGTNYKYRHQYASYADVAGEFLDFSATADGDVTVNRHSDAVTPGFIIGVAESGAGLAYMVAHNLQKAAEKGWASGRCVDLELAPSDEPGLEPGATVTIDAASRSTVATRPTGGTVVGTLAGAGVLDPTGRRPETPAIFRFTAPSERDQSGTMSVESRSKRGIGTGRLTLPTEGRAFAASGARVENSGSGTTCSLSAPFTIPGNTVTFAFTPAGESGGTWTASGGPMDLIVERDGTYTVALSDDKVPALLVLDGTVATIAPGGSRFPASADFEFSLTPTQACPSPPRRRERDAARRHRAACRVRDAALLRVGPPSEIDRRLARRLDGD